VDPPQTPLQLGCWSKLFIVLILGVAAIAVTLAFWLRSTADLDAERARAVALGVEMDWEKLGVTADRRAERTTVADLTMLLKRAKPYEGELDVWATTIPGDLIHWDSGIDAELDTAIDRLPGGLCVQVYGTAIANLGRHEAARLLPLLGGYNETYEARELMQARSLRGAGDMAALSARLVRLAATAPSLWNFYATLHITHIFHTHVLRHRSKLEPAATAQQARLLANALAEQLDLTIRCQPALWDAALRMDCTSLLRALNIRLPALMSLDPDVTRDLFQRAGRRAVMARAVDAAAWIIAHGLPDTYADMISLGPEIPPLTPWNSLSAVFTHTVDTNHYGCLCTHGSGRPRSQLYDMVGRYLSQRARLLVVAADLDGTAWPSDPCDPAGGPLRPIIRDGVVIGAYGCGEDQKDDGGTTSTDWCYPLRARLGSPRAADPPKVP
jgi:hypothetical protein